MHFDAVDVPSSNGYDLGNSFRVSYNDLKTLAINTALDIDISDEFSFNTTFNYFKHDASTFLEEAWNLPSYTGTVKLNYNNRSWYAGLTLLLRGSTKDFEYFPNPLLLEVIPTGEIVSNKAYMDLNFNAGYIFSDRLTAFARINNALGENYHRFYNYQVLPLQIMAGITYKFDLD
jgi:hypothetical protein